MTKKQKHNLASLTREPAVRYAFAVVALIAVGSVTYYIIGSRPPQPSLQGDPASVGTVTASGAITPSQNPDLAFEAGGRVTLVSAKVGQTVARGALLASLDTSSLAAVRDQAAANLRSQQAKLADLQAGPRDVDLSPLQTAVDQAKQSLANAYQDAQNDIANSYGSILGALHSNVDPLYNNPNSQSSSLVFATNDSQAAQNSVLQRVTVNAEMGAWANEQLADSPDPVTVEGVLVQSLSHVQTLQSYANTLTSALAGTITTTSFNSTSLASAQANLAVFRGSVQAALTTFHSDTQAIANAKLAVKSAQDRLDAVKAGATPQQIEAQQAGVQAASASLDAARAALSHALIVAPYSGTVTAVDVSVGDLVDQNQVGVSLAPQSALQLTAYLSEIDAAHVAAGDSVDVTVDAYGASRAFPASVVSVNRSPVMQGSVPAYKVVIQFASDDPALAPGMTGNAVIHPSH